MSTGFDRNGHVDPDDYFAETRMGFGDHIEVLRLHLWRAIVGFLIALVLSFFVGKHVVMFIAAPVEQQLGAFYDKRLKMVKDEIAANNPDFANLDKPRPIELTMPVSQFERRFNAKVNQDDRVKVGNQEHVGFTLYYKPVGLYEDLDTISKIAGRRPSLTTLSIQEAFMVYFKVCMVTAFVLASPWIFYQIWSFIAAGLYPHEKKYINIFLPFSLGLFLAGVAVCEIFVIPKAIEALLWFNEWLGLEPDLRLNEWLSFALMMPLVFGLSFQTPLVMLFFARLGIVDAEFFKGKRRMAWFILAVFSAVFSPSTDAFSMMFLWVPLCLLYELGILLIKWSPARDKFDLDVPEPQELIEV